MNASEKKIRVVVVDDSALARTSISLLLALEGDIEVVGEAEDGFAAVTMVEELQPDVVTMDVEMPRRSGLETIEHIMARQPVPIIVIAGTAIADDDGTVFTAMEIGAVDVLTTPVMDDEGGGETLRAMVRTAAQTPVFAYLPDAPPTVIPTVGGVQAELVVAAAGVGGLRSIMDFLSRLPPAAKTSVIVHHALPDEALMPFAKEAAERTGRSIRIAEPPSVPLVQGELVIATNVLVTVDSEGKVSVVREPPSATRLLESVANVYGPRAVGVLLSGQGTDGSEGLSALRRAGGRTFVERVTGKSPTSQMPLSAIQCGAADEVTSLAGIGEALQPIMG